MTTIWQIGRHRLARGDCRDAERLRLLFGGEQARCLVADPPYGMRKAGVLNDTLRGAPYVAFNAAWYAAITPYLASLAGCYVFGMDLSLLEFYSGVLREELARKKVCNLQIVTWHKMSASGQRSPFMHMYPVADEKILVFAKGRNPNDHCRDNYFEGFEPLRGKLHDACKKHKISNRMIKEAAGKGMASHWLCRSQWEFIPEVYYIALQAWYPEAFPWPWAELQAEYKAALRLKAKHSDVHFDNVHDGMTTVWSMATASPKEKRHCGGHPTVKAQAVLQRIMRTSCPPDGLVVDPFSGTGSSILAAERTGRRCYAVELSPRWCDVTLRRFEIEAGLKAEIIAQTDATTLTDAKTAKEDDPLAV